MTRGSCRYYARSVRKGRRVVHEYYGTGPEAQLAAALDADRRRRRRGDRAARAAAAAAWAAASGPVDRLAGATDLVAEAVLLAAGYHRHHQGEWRRRQHGGDG